MKKPLSAAPARLQRMLLQLQAYDIEVKHLPGKSIPVADTLSRYYVEDTCSDLTDGLDFQIHYVAPSPNMSDQRLDEVRVSTGNDTQLCTLRKVILDGWPDKRSNCPPTIAQYWTFRDELTVTDGIIMKGEKIVIPREMRQTMLDKIHAGHLGIAKCTRRARDVMFWPGITKDISDLVQKCDICLTHRCSNTKEPMKPHQVPEQPWQVVATDIFTLDGVDYLITVDYYSRFFEIDKLPDTKSLTVIRKLKTHFARYGICQKLVSDNAPQFTSDQFSTFAREWGFEQTTSSPMYAQSNGLAEKTVQTAKRLLTKAKADNRDLYVAILEYRNCPLECGYSPSQLLMSRRLRSILPTTKTLLKPQTVNTQTVREKMKKSRSTQKHYFDRQAKPLPPLTEGQAVRIQMKNKWVKAKVLNSDNDRSYTVQTENGGIYRRNRRHLMNTKDTCPEMPECFPNVLLQPEPCSKSKTTESAKPPNQTQSLTHNTSSAAAKSQQYVTRYGRSVKPTSRLIEEA